MTFIHIRNMTILGIMLPCYQCWGEIKDNASRLRLPSTTSYLWIAKSNNLHNTVQKKEIITGEPGGS